MERGRGVGSAWVPLGARQLHCMEPFHWNPNSHCTDSTVGTFPHQYSFKMSCFHPHNLGAVNYDT